MTPEQMSEKARRLFEEGFHCSQAVFAVGAEKQGVKSEDVIRALAPFAGGVAFSGDTCGALPGALAALGVRMGKASPKGKNHRDLFRLSSRMVQLFKEITASYGGPKCSDIARVDWKDREQVRKFRKGPESRRCECGRVVGETARILGELLGG